MSKASEEDQ